MTNTEEFHMLADELKKNGFCCKTCRHKSIKKDDVEAPKLYSWGGVYLDDDMACPFLCGDPYYNYIPDDDFFCAYWEKKHETD